MWLVPSYQTHKRIKFLTFKTASFYISVLHSDERVSLFDLLRLG